MQNDSIAQQCGEQCADHWHAIASAMPWETPDHVIEHLQYEFWHLLRDDHDAVLIARQTVNLVFTQLRPHIAEAFIRLAHEMRFSRDPATVGAGPVKSGKVPRGIVAGHARAKRESVR